jgi:hypothetical protein
LTTEATHDAQPSTPPRSDIRQHRLEVLLRAETPIAHHMEVRGNVALVQTKGVILDTGEKVKIPFITGATMRHLIREASALALLDAAGMLHAGALSESALRLLFAGGMLTGRGDASKFSLEAYRKMADLIPSLALLGGCADSRVVPGKIQVDDAELVCSETMDRMSPEVRGYLAGQRKDAEPAKPYQPQTRRAHVESMTRVRMDPMLNPGKRTLLTTQALAAAEQQAEKGEAAHAEDDAVAREKSKSTMMPFEYEVVTQGSLFRWGITATTHSVLEADALYCALSAAMNEPQVGGKRGGGHGRLKVLAVWNRDRPLAPAHETGGLVPLDGPVLGSAFRAHVKAHAAEIRAWLGVVDA